MKLLLTDTHAIELLAVLNERKKKYTNLAGRAKGRMNAVKFNKNAEKLFNRHTAKADKATLLIKMIAEQI